MKTISTMLVTVTLLIIGFLFLFSGINNAGNNDSKRLARKVQTEEYLSQFKRRDFIKERREIERKKINRAKSARQIAAGRYQDDFMEYSRQNHGRSRYDDFR